MSDIVLSVENLSKLYRLGEIGTGTISHDLNRWWHKIRGKEDPFSQVGVVNDRTQKASSDYVWALKDIDFQVKKGDVLGIIGRNGAGKSTLLKLISRITSPSKGEIKVKGRIASLLEVGTGMHPEMTAMENIYLNGAILGMTKKEIARKFDEILDFAGCTLYVNTPVKRFSSGMRVRLGFAVAAFLEPEILIVDEVLAVGDAEFQNKAIGKIQDVSKNEGRTILFVSHNMGSIKLLCKTGLLLNKGQIEVWDSVNKVVDKYLSQSKSSEKNYESGAVRYIKVIQIDNAIQLEVHYKCDRNIYLPNLGFVIRNSEGIPIAGINPSMMLNTIHQKNFPREGKVIARINQPKLLDGTYYFSIYFGDKNEDFFSDVDCVSLDVSAMSNILQTFRSVDVGSVIPDCTFDFY